MFLTTTLKLIKNNIQGHLSGSGNTTPSIKVNVF